jgi:WhiB family redox-sensing transcriptional regulator
MTVNDGVKPGKKLAGFTVDSEPWMKRGACFNPTKDMDVLRANVARFFPGKTNPTRQAVETARAKAVCAVCDVAADCLAYAEKTHIQFGIWGGLTENDRRKRRKQQRQEQQGKAA